MVATRSNMLPLGIIAPSFTLTEVVNENTISLKEPDGGKGYLICFICNHCPYVLHLLDSLTGSCNHWQRFGIRVFMISSNDIENYPQDCPSKMKDLAEDRGFEFPYLFDEQQTVALSYRAACTPDFFLFDQNLRLFYRGQYDDSRPGNGIDPSGKDLDTAITNLLENKPVPVNQKPSLGCNLKWKTGNEPEYFKNDIKLAPEN